MKSFLSASPITEAAARKNTDNADGSIKKVPYWLDNVLEQVEPFNPFKKVEAETMAWGYGLKTIETGSDIYVSNIDEGEYLMLKGVDFRKGASRFEANVSNSRGRTAYIEVRLDAVDGPLCRTLKIDPAKGFKTVGCSLKDAKGVHDLYFVFKGEAGHDLFVWDWWRMK